MFKYIIVALIFSLPIYSNAGQHFKVASAVPMQELIDELNIVYKEKIKDKEVIKITVEGHTDSRASDAYNQKLSEARAKSAVDVLVKLGADKSKITSIGKGESQLATTGTSEEDHAKNRRVVVIVESKDGVTKSVISEAKECKEKVVEKVIEKKLIKKHIISLDFYQGVTSNETKNYTTGGTQVGEGKIETGYIPSVNYQYQADNGLVPKLGVDIQKNPKLNFGLGYEF